MSKQRKKRKKKPMPSSALQELLSRGSFQNEFSKVFSEKFTKNLKGSEIWQELVAKYGEEKAEEIAREVKADIF
jgi:hypothetical protein